MIESLDKSIYFFSLLSLFFLCYDFKRKTLYSLIFIFVVSPYVGAIISFYSANRILNLSRISVEKIIYLLLSNCVFLLYMFNGELTIRGGSQYIQFLIMQVFIANVIFVKDSLFKNKKQQDMVINSLFSACFLYAVIILSMNLIDSTVRYKFNGVNEDSMLVMISFFTCFVIKIQNNNTNMKHFLLFFIVALVIYLQESRAAMIVLIFSSIITLLSLRALKAFVIFLSLVFLLITIFYSEYYSLAYDFTQLTHSNRERFAMYQFAYDKFLIGYNANGIGMLDDVMEQIYASGYTVAKYPHPHSSYLRFIFELGSVGLLYPILLIFGIVYGLLLKKGAERGSKAIIVFVSSLLLFSFFDSIFYSFYRGGVVILVLYVLVSETYISKVNSRNYQC